MGDGGDCGCCGGSGGSAFGGASCSGTKAGAFAISGDSSGEAVGGTYWLANRALIQNAGPLDTPTLDPMSAALEDNRRVAEELELLDLAMPVDEGAAAVLATQALGLPYAISGSAAQRERDRLARVVELHEAQRARLQLARNAAVLGRSRTQGFTRYADSLERRRRAEDALARYTRCDSVSGLTGDPCAPPGGYGERVLSPNLSGTTREVARRYHRPVCGIRGVSWNNWTTQPPNGGSRGWKQGCLPGGGGTGTLIADNIVLTAGHVVDKAVGNSSRMDPSQPGDFPRDFKGAFSLVNIPLIAIFGAVVSEEGDMRSPFCPGQVWVVDAILDYRLDDEYDYAVLRLAPNDMFGRPSNSGDVLPGERFGRLPLRCWDLAMESEVWTIGHPKGASLRISKGTVACHAECTGFRGLGLGCLSDADVGTLLGFNFFGGHGAVFGAVLGSLVDFFDSDGPKNCVVASGMNALPGNSGGPLLDRSGSVRGIMRKGWRDEESETRETLEESWWVTPWGARYAIATLNFSQSIGQRLLPCAAVSAVIRKYVASSGPNAHWNVLPTYCHTRERAFVFFQAQPWMHLMAMRKRSYQPWSQGDESILTQMTAPEVHSQIVSWKDDQDGLYVAWLTSNRRPVVLYNDGRENEWERIRAVEQFEDDEGLTFDSLECGWYEPRTGESWLAGRPAPNASSQAIYLLGVRREPGPNSPPVRRKLIDGLGARATTIRGWAIGVNTYVVALLDDGKVVSYKARRDYSFRASSDHPVMANVAALDAVGVPAGAAPQSLGHAFGFLVTLSQSNTLELRSGVTVRGGEVDWQPGATLLNAGNDYTPDKGVSLFPVVRPRPEQHQGAGGSSQEDHLIVNAAYIVGGQLKVWRWSGRGDRGRVVDVSVPAPFRADFVGRGIAGGVGLTTQAGGDASRGVGLLVDHAHGTASNRNAGASFEVIPLSGLTGLPAGWKVGSRGTVMPEDEHEPNARIEQPRGA